MAWDDEMVAILRGHLQDYPTPTEDPNVEDPPKYSDDRLAELILIAAQSLQAQVKFPQFYTISVPNVSMKPDPTAAATRNNDFINLTILKAACMLANAEVREFTAQGISIRDGTSAIALQRSPASLKLMQETYCKAFSDALYSYEINGTVGVGGEIVLGPHGGSAYWGSDYPYLGPCNRNDRSW